MKQIDGDILKDKLKALLEHYQYRDDDFAIGRTCALADAMKLIDMQEKIDAIPVEWLRGYDDAFDNVLPISCALRAWEEGRLVND